ncbi:hypothetical protein HK097_007240 [Rhizophlyctis rosea]|uniref:Uncharacterized protein n=1 Tax=Rhizophlyctis rosea TaxID=64517 RepID=A0AAD5X2D4_9FUNG|nr:hypothetical protein HK097_007240 [Rhizophlyctis rosea]
MISTIIDKDLAVKLIQESTSIEGSSKKTYTTSLNQIDKIGAFPLFHEPEKLWERIKEHCDKRKRKKTESTFEACGNHAKSLQKVCEEIALSLEQLVAVYDERCDHVITDPVVLDMHKRHMTHAMKKEAFQKHYTTFWQTRATVRREEQKAMPAQGEPDDPKANDSYHYQFAVAMLAQAFGDLVLRSDLGHTVVQDFKPEDKLRFDVDRMLFLVGETNKTKDRGLQIQITDTRVQQHLKHLAYTRLKNGQRYLFEKDQQPDKRKDMGWYGKAVTVMFESVFEGVSPAPRTVTDFRRIISQAGKDKSRGIPEAEAAHAKRMNHSMEVDDKYYDKPGASSSTAPPPAPETFVGAGGVNLLN